MPYDSLDQLPASVRKRSGKDQKQWMAVFNSVFRKTGNDTQSRKAAFGAIGMDAEDDRQVPITCFASSVFPDWDAAAVYEVQVMRSGLWKDHPSYGEISITNADLATAVRNFRSSSSKPFLDYNHAISDQDAKPGDQIAIGWMSDMWIETLGGARLEPADADKSKDVVLLLKASYEVNAEANEKIKAKEYALFSPTWYTEYQNAETGESQGMTIIGGAATNIPFFSGMQGFIAMVADVEALVSAAREGEVKGKIDEVAKGDEQGDTTAVADALVKAAQAKWEERNKTIDAKVSFSFT